MRLVVTAYRWQPLRPVQWPEFFVTIFIPMTGGDDALVLYGIPELSAHKVPAFLALAVGVIWGPEVMRCVFGFEMKAA